MFRHQIKILTRSSLFLPSNYSSYLFSSLPKKNLQTILNLSSLSPKKTTPTNIFNYKLLYSFCQQSNKKKNPQTPTPTPKQQKFNKLTQDMMNKPPSQNQQSNSFQTDNKTTKILFFVGVSLIFSIYIMMSMQQKRVKNKLDSKKATFYTGKADIGGEWELLDTKGKPFGNQNLKGSYYLIYFGFTNCPDICPTSLMKLAKAIQKINKLPQASYIKLKTIFVSVDPDRDTPQKIQQFLQYFDKSIIGVTGKSNTDPALKKCLKTFKIYASKVEFQDQNTQKLGRKSYTIDHTIFTYLISDSNQYLTFLGANLGQHQLVQQIMQYIAQNQQKKTQAKRIH